MKPIHTTDAPAPAGHYSQAIVHNGLVFVSAQLPIDPANPAAPLGTAREQAKRCLENIRAIVEAAGSGLEKVLSVRVYVSDMALWEQVNEAYAGFFGEHKPARAVVPVGKLHKGADVVMEAIAAV